MRRPVASRDGLPSCPSPPRGRQARARLAGLPRLAYFALGDRLELHWLREQVDALCRESRWEALARHALLEDLLGEQSALTEEVLRAGPEELPAGERIAAWVSRNALAAERWLQVLADVKADSTPDLATLSVAVREVRNLMHGAASLTAAAATEAFIPRSTLDS